MDQVLDEIQTVTIVVFMVGNLLEVGLRLDVPEAVAALRNVRFVVTSLLWCFVLGPALALHRHPAGDRCGDPPQRQGGRREARHLMGVEGAPQGAITMCILAIFLGAILSGFAAAAMLKRYGAPASGLLHQPA